MSDSLDRQYAAFVSYRHADNKEPGRQWAAWIHHTLETYEVPQDLVGKPNHRGESVPASLYPVFRDEEELPADADLSLNIRRALENSRLLVVLCSPRAVESRFVADEIRYFKELGRADRILALMIDGEPNASDDPAKQRAGISPESECLPEPLRFGVARADGSIDWSARTEPIAADVRPEGKPGQGFTSAAAYREALQQEGRLQPGDIDRRVQDFEQRLALATHKIIAGALGVPLGELTQRDKAYQLEKERKRARALRRWIAVITMLALMAVAAGFVAFKQRLEAEEQRHRAEGKTRDLQAAAAEASMREGNYVEATLLALLSLPSERAMPTLYRAIMMNDERYLPEDDVRPFLKEPKAQNTESETEASLIGNTEQVGSIISTSIDRRVLIRKSHPDVNCIGMLAFNLETDQGKVLGSYCQGGRKDYALPRLSPKGNWLVTDMLLQEDNKILRIASEMDSMDPGVGKGEIADNACIAFNDDETLVAYRNFDDQVVIRDVESAIENPPLRKIIPHANGFCPISIEKDSVLVATLHGKIRSWSVAPAVKKLRLEEIKNLYNLDFSAGTYNNEHPTDTDKFDKNKEELGTMNAALRKTVLDSDLFAISMDKKRLATLKYNNSQDEDRYDNQCSLWDIKTARELDSYKNVECDFLGMAAGYNSPQELHFSSDGTALIVRGRSPTTATVIPILPQGSALLKFAFSRLPCGLNYPWIHVSHDASELCQEAMQADSLKSYLLPGQ